MATPSHTPMLQSSVHSIPFLITADPFPFELSLPLNIPLPARAALNFPLTKSIILLIFLHLTRPHILLLSLTCPFWATASRGPMPYEILMGKPVAYVHPSIPPLGPMPHHLTPKTPFARDIRVPMTITASCSLFSPSSAVPTPFSSHSPSLNQNFSFTVLLFFTP
jgi:hypothetical protein